MSLLLWGACLDSPASPTPATASDGLVFVRSLPGHTDLWWGRLADGAVGPLLERPESEETWPFWSPDAGRLVYESRPREKRAAERLLLFDPATGRSEPLFAGRDLRQHWAAWSPDGRRVAYAYSELARRAPLHSVGEVEIATRRRRVVGPPAAARFFFRPEYAPDGGRLVVERGDAKAPWHEVWILEPGREPRRLVGGLKRRLGKARFTRDGKWVLLTSRPRRGGPGNLLLVALDGSVTRMLASTPASDDHSARPSPARDEIAFISNRDGSPDLFVAELSGGEARNLTRTPGRHEAAPRWSPDGEKIVLSVRPVDGKGEVLSDYRVVVVDRRGRRLFETPGVMADWMPPPGP